jgi:hypothetical protein
MLGTRLAERLGLPTTPVEIIDASEDLIRLTPQLCMATPRQRIPCRPGPQFGSPYPGDPHRPTLLDFLPDPELEKVVNLEDFAGMLVLDKWTCNSNGRQTVVSPHARLRCNGKTKAREDSPSFHFLPAKAEY